MALDKLYYSIGEVARILGVASSTLRYWDKAGVLVPSKRQGGRRFYTESDVQKALQLKQLLDVGYTLPGAAKRLRHEAQVAQEVMEQLREILDVIKKLRSEI